LPSGLIGAIFWPWIHAAFRFNRRFYPMTAFNSVLGLVVHAVAPTYAELYRARDGLASNRIGMK